MARTSPHCPDAADVPDLQGAPDSVPQPNRDARAPGEVDTVKGNGIWLGLVIAILIMVLSMVQGIALADAQYTVTVSDYCNVREEPDKDSADTGNLYAGDVVTGTGYQSGWVQVDASVEAGTGWVREDMLTLADYPTGRYTNVSGGRVHIRKTPDGDHAHWLDAGHTVDVIRWVAVDGSAWAYTKKGYIKFDCLEESANDAI